MSIKNLHEFIDEPVEGTTPADNPQPPKPASEPPVERQSHTEHPPLDDIEDVKWLAEDDPRRIAVEKWRNDVSSS